MSELTEKFFNEEDIPEGIYYLKLKTGGVVIDEYPEIIYDAYGEFERYGFKDSHIDNIDEVLAPVPSYEELQELKKENARIKEQLDDLRQKNAELNIQIAEHVKKCLCCENFNFTREIQFLNHKISELREANQRTDVVSHLRGKSLINERERTAELENENKRLKGWLEFIATMQWGELKDCKNYAKQALNGSEVMK